MQISQYIKLMDGVIENNQTLHPKNSFGVSYFAGVDDIGTITAKEGPTINLAYFENESDRTEFLSRFEDHPSMPAPLK